MNTRYIKSRTIILGVITFLFLSCNSKITDFFEAIIDYGYRSEIPLGAKSIPVDEHYLGGFVYDGLPLIISEKDKITYEINFLTTSLYKEDRVIEAHATIINKHTFLNLDMGDFYCFMKVNLVFNEELNVKVIKDGLKELIQPKELKNWLKDHADDGEYEYVREGETYSGNAYYSFDFSKITIERAYKIQENKLLEEKKELFSSCSSYEDYEELIIKYPEQDLMNIGQNALLDQCYTISDYETFISYFPNSRYVQMAKEKIEAIRENIRREELIAKEKDAFDAALKLNTLEGYEDFIETGYSDFYIDSAKFYIKIIAGRITKDKIEWEWTNGNSEKALQLIFYKIDYADELFDIPWLVDRMAYYAIVYNNEDWKNRTLSKMDKLIKRNLSSDQLLDLYLAKGFLLWSMGKSDLAVNVFQSKIETTFTNTGITFKDAVKSKFKSYKSQNLTFPNQKDTWKRIKKL